VLGEIAPALETGLPLGLTLAVALGGGRVRERRRRTALNRAMHELRRPLQALVLAGSHEGRVRDALRMTVAAVADLDREINREPVAADLRPVVLDSVVRDAAERWKAEAANQGRALRVSCHTGDAVVLADSGCLACALDNLVANALEHGTLRVELCATLGAGRARVAVADGGAADRPATPRRRDPRRGHGLPVVTEIARRHGGRFFWVRSKRGSVAVVELPLADVAA
jgi:signal transduction histidine kinase